MTKKSAHERLFMWIFILAKLFGVWPFNTKMLACGGKTSKATALFAISRIVIYFGCMIAYFIGSSIAMRTRKYSLSEVIVVRLILFAFGITPAISIVLNIVHQQHISNIFMTFENFDRMVSVYQMS